MTGSKRMLKSSPWPVYLRLASRYAQMPENRQVGDPLYDLRPVKVFQRAQYLQPVAGQCQECTSMVDSIEQISCNGPMRRWGRISTDELFCIRRYMLYAVKSGERVNMSHRRYTKTSILDV